MIIENISATVNSYTLNGKIIVPSPIMTATPQEENGDLTYAPNFQLKLGDNDKILKVTDIVNTSFTFGDYNYTSYMKVTNRSGDITTLQFVDGLTASEPIPPTPVVHTLEFSYNEVSTSRDNYTNVPVRSRATTVLYDNEPLVLNNDMIQGNNHCEYTIYTQNTGAITFLANQNLDVGEYVDNVTVSYEGLTATCNVNVTITDSTPAPDPDLSSHISLILGSNYDVVNDMTEEDATNKANEILYGEES